LLPWWFFSRLVALDVFGFDGVYQRGGRQSIDNIRHEA
jgi:hypothetical protein